MLKDEVFAKKHKNRNIIIVVFFGVALLITSFFMNVVYIGLLGLIYIIASSLLYNPKLILGFTTLSSIAVLNSLYHSTNRVSVANIVSSLLVYYIIAVALAQNIRYKQKNKEKLKDKNDELYRVKIELETIFQNTQDNMFLVEVSHNNNFKYVRNNTSHQKSTGIELKDIKDKKPRDLFGEKFGKEVESKFIKVVNSKSKLTFEEELTLPTGNKIWRIMLNPVLVDGEVTHIVGSRQDITKQKEENYELIESRERLRNIIETTQDGFWIIGDNQKFIDVNEAYCKMTGYSREELLSLQISDLEYMESIEDTKRRTKEIIEQGHQIFETKHIKKNGEVFDVEVSVSCLTREPVEMLCFCRDITARNQDKKNLLEMKERVQNIINGANVGTWEWHVETGKTIFNDKWADIIGYKLNELHPTNINTWKKLTHPDDLILAESQLKKVMNKEQEYYDIEIRMKHKNGKWIWINDRGKVTKWSEDGKPIVLSGTHFDITDRKKAEEKQREYHSLIQYILKYNTSGVAVHDKDMNYMYVSERYLDRYGVKEKEIIGKNHYEVFPDLPDKWKKVHKRSLNGEIISKDEDIFYREDGSIDWTKWETRPWYNKDGNIGGIIVYTEVITEQKELEAQIYNEREQFKTTLLSVGDAIISTDKNGIITVMNKVAEDLTEWNLEEARGKPLEEVLVIINEFTRETCENPARKALEADEIVEMANHTILITKNGQEIPIEDSAAPIKDRDGKITGAVIVFRDFSEKREKQREIEFLSYHDHLTGLFNRRFMEKSINELDTVENLPISLIIVDVNGLKLTNDAYGHEMGDNLLIEVGHILNDSCRDKDIVCRVGGDEFVVILPNTTIEETSKTIDKIAKKSMNASLGSVIISLAIGSASKENINTDIFEVYREADNEMYKNKIKYGKTMRSKTIEKVLIDINNKYDHEQIHTERVSQYCAKIAKAMKLSNKEIEDARAAGALHDIGKIVVSPELLKKQQKLTNDEWEEIKKHPIISYQLLKSVDEYTHLAEAVLYHHEKLDGSGYPENLYGDNIPLLSKIISVADAYEAMTSRRPYQKPKNKEEAINELLKHSGTQFDEEIVDVFVNVVL